MNQLQLPLSFEELIPENHLVRVVNTVVDSLELKTLYDRYKEGGCPAYINFMWIAGGNKPDFRTIHRFRLDMRDILEEDTPVALFSKLG